MATFWRLHPADRSFSAEDATSMRFDGQGEPQHGYSCFAEPWHLYIYVWAMWPISDGTPVIEFAGTKVGTGNDGEDLAVPTGGILRRTTWGEFKRMLPSVPLPASPRFASWLGPEYRTWEDLAQRWAYLDQGRPEQDWLVQKMLGTKTADMAHRPNDDGPPAHDLLADNGEWAAPEDVYEHPDRYTFGYGGPLLAETVRTLRAARDKPGTPITVYRAQPTGAGLRTGDWVSLSRGYAETDLRTEPEGRSVETYTVPAATVRYAGDDLMEWGYFGPAIAGTRKATAGGTLPPGITYRYDDLGGGSGRIVALDPSTPHQTYQMYGVGMLSWNEEGQISWVQSYEGYERKGMATRMLEEARKHRPDIHHSDELSSDAQQWIRATGRQYFQLPEKSDGPILRNWNGYSQESQQRILATYVDLVEGSIRPEPKERPPLVGLWTAKVNAADRIIVDDLPGGGWVLLGAVFEHNYSLAEQQIAGWLAWRQRTASAPRVFYHVTAYRNWPSIRAHGLVPQSGTAGKIWLFTEVPPALHYSDSYANPDVPPCILVVRAPDAVETTAGIPGAYWVDEVPPANIIDIIRPEDIHHYDNQRWSKVLGK